MTNAKKAKKQRAAGTRKPPARRGKQGGGSKGLWTGLAALALVLVVIAVVAGGDSGAPADEGTVSIDRASGPVLQVGEAVPAFTAPKLDGSGTISWSDFAGKPTVLAIWAPWCAHCQVELPRLAEALANHPDIQIVTVTTAIGQQPGPTPQAYLDSEGLTFPVAKDDADATLMQGLGVESFPTTYFVGSDGKVVDVKVGEVGLLPDGSVDPTVLDQILTTLEQS